jgi:hypothetical protein
MTFKDFENGVVKVQLQKAHELTPSEKRATNELKKPRPIQHLQLQQQQEQKQSSTATNSFPFGLK